MLRIDGKDLCVSRQARCAGHTVGSPGFLVGAFLVPSVSALCERLALPSVHIYRDNGAVLHGVLCCARRWSSATDLPVSDRLTGLRQIIS